MQSSKFSCRELPRAVIVDLPERVSAETEGNAFKEVLNSILEKKMKYVGINLGKTDYINSMTISIFLIYRKNSEKAGITFSLISPNRLVMNLLETFNITHLFSIFKSEKAFIKKASKG
jgi:anti-anti-sigma factor